MLNIIKEEHLSALQHTIEGLADIRLSFYDPTGLLLLCSRKETSLVSQKIIPEAGEREVSNFIGDNIRTAVLRRDLIISEAPSGEYYFFVPAGFGKKAVVLVGGGFLLSERDSLQDQSCTEELPEAEAAQGQLPVKDYKEIRRISRSIQNLLSSILAGNAEKTACQKKYIRTKAIFDLFSTINEHITIEEIYELMSDILLNLFHVDSLSFMTGDGNIFKPVFSAGKLRKYLVDTMQFEESAWIIAEVIQEKKPLFYDNPIDVRCLGLKEPVRTVSIFPVSIQKNDTRLLCLFNSVLDNEQESEISELCQYMNLLASMASARNIYHDRLKEMTVLNFATSGLRLVFDKPEMMYNSIVDAAVRISKAEKGSLMLADDKEELKIKAACGINNWFAQDVRVRSGEGIAGKVFRESIPIVSQNIEKDFSVRKKHNYRTPSFMSIPLRVGEETIGVLNISDKITGEVFRNEDLAMILHFANYASIALKGSSYYSLAEHMKELSITDSLTELYNRRYFQDRLLEETDRSERHHLRFALCIIDIDDFKMFNDSEGHPAGDTLLSDLARLIHGSLRAIDVLARIGGEEFAVIMPQTDREEAFAVAERVRYTVKQKLTRSWKQYPKENITISIGIAVFPADDKNAKKLLWKADQALYKAKVLGKDKTVIWDEETEDSN